MTFRCPVCGFHDNPIWKPLFWKPYFAYASFEDFHKEYPMIVLDRKVPYDDGQYLYYLRGKTRVMVHRLDKLFLVMTDRKLYEKTPSESENWKTERAYKSRCGTLDDWHS